MKYRGIKTRILKEKKKEITKQNKKEISEERKQEIVQELKKQGYTNRSMDYKELQELYKSYSKEMSEKQFAEILGITGASYNSIKYKKGTRAKILKEKAKKITEERIKEIQEELKKQKYTNKLLDYQEFKKLYKIYQNEMEEKQFARILGITNSSFSSMKNRGTKARILKEEKDEITEERIKEIREKLKEYENKLIDYKEFQELHEPYQEEINEQDFAKILGIKYANYMNIKNNGQKTEIQFKREELDTIKYQIQNENREYKREELEEMCKKYNITLKELLKSVYGQGKLVEKLINKDIIYIGKCELPREFSEKYAKQLLEVVNKLSKELAAKYRMRNIEEDIASETLIYILNNKGDIVKNSETDEEALSSIEGYMYISLKYKCIKNLTINKTISLDTGIIRGKRFTKGGSLHEIIKDSKADFGEKIENNLDRKRRKESATKMKQCYEEDIVSRMKQCYEEGKNNTEAIETVIEEYEISKEELLEILRKELMKKKKIKKTKTGKVYLGEEIE